MKRNRGFTLTEILAVIVIISLLLLLIVPTIMNGIKNKENDTKTTQTKLIYEAASEFIGSFGDEYPDVPNSTYCISIKELIDSGYINDNVKDVLTQKAYDKTKSVEVKIDGKGNKTYTLSNATCTEKHNTNSITFNIYPSNDTWSTSKTVNINYPDVQGYSKQFYKSNDPNFDCNSASWQTYTGQQITYNQNGKICARMVGDAGKENITNNSKVFKIDTIKPTCTFNMPTVNGKNGWYVSNVNFSITNTDTGNVDVKSGIHKWDIRKGEKKPNYNNVSSINHTADTESVTYYCHVRDKAGNENNNSKTFKKDTTKPVITLTPNTQVTWVKGGLNVTVTIKDTTSGIATNQKIYYAWSKSNSTTPSYNKYVAMTNSASAKSTSVVVPKETLTGQYYLWIKQDTMEDMAGNKNNKVVSKVFKFDNTVPVVNIEGNPTVWTNKDVTLNIKASDSDSGLAPQPYSFDGGNTWTDNPRKTYTTNTNNIQIWVKDRVGNIDKKTVNITKIDRVKPSCTSSGGSWNWTNRSIVLVGTCVPNDSLSPCNSVTKTYPNTSNFNLTNQTPGTVCDQAGNCTACPANQPVKIDISKPTCPVSGESTSWVNTSRTIAYGCSDTGGSGCTTATQTIKYDYSVKTSNIAWTVYDNAGNSTNCSRNAKIYVDTVAPTCESNIWVGQAGPGKTCGSTYYQNVADNLSGIYRVDSRHCYVKEDGRWADWSWGRVCHDWVLNDSHWTNSWYGNGSTWQTVRHGLNAVYATVGLQFWVMDKAGNETYCPQEFKSFHYYNVGCG